MYGDAVLKIIATCAATANIAVCIVMALARKHLVAVMTPRTTKTSMVTDALMAVGAKGIVEAVRIVANGDKWPLRRPLMLRPVASRYGQSD